MGFISILDRRKSPYQEKARPAFFQDLNLDQVIERIRLDWGGEVSSFYYYFPADASCEDYRREVFADIRLAGAYEALCEFVEEMKRRREAAGFQAEVEEKLQKAVWRIREVSCYCGAFRRLAGRLREIPLESHGMLLFREYLEEYLSKEEFRRMEAVAAELLEKMSGFRLVLTYENDRMTITEGEAEGAYERFLDKCFPESNKEFRSPFEASPEWADLERELIKTYRKRNPEFFEKAEGFYREYGEYADGVLIRFASEIEFYLSFYFFETRMRERGFAFAVPEMISEDNEAGGCEADIRQMPRGSTLSRPVTETSAEDRVSGAGEDGRAVPGQEADGYGADGKGKESCGRMYAHGLYDLALACAGHEVVSNEMEFGPEEKFYVLTGPNQGGKTTYARSLGQLVYFAKMGLDVPAESAGVYRFTDILTHFSVEESIETGRGKLKEELTRLAPMMEFFRGERAGSLDIHDKNLHSENAGIENLHGENFCGGRTHGENIHLESPVGDNSCRMRGKAFVIINELFTTAANYDACIMGKRVLKYFLARDCHGIYVTHLKELSEAWPRIVSLRALRDENGVPTFRIARGSEESRDSAGKLVEKHGLTYEKLSERLKERLA